MKTLPFVIVAIQVVIACLGAPAMPTAQSGSYTRFLFESTDSGPPGKLLWETEPRVRYDLFSSHDMRSWTHVAGFLALADGPALQHSFTPAAKSLFKVVPIDEQPPVVVAQYPAIDGFAAG